MRIINLPKSHSISIPSFTKHTIRDTQWATRNGDNQSRQLELLLPKKALRSTKKEIISTSSYASTQISVQTKHSMIQEQEHQ